MLNVLEQQQMSKKKKETSPHYELLYIVSNKYTEEEVGGLAKKVEELLAKFDAKITFTEFWGKKKFCYQINHFNHGCYTLVEFDAAEENVNKINHELRISNEVLRHMIVKRPLRTVEEIQAEKKKQVVKKLESNKAEAKKEEVKIQEEKKAKVKPKQVDLKDLDEKLDKILDTDDLL